MAENITVPSEKTSTRLEKSVPSPAAQGAHTKLALSPTDDFEFKEFGRVVKPIERLKRKRNGRDVNQ
jgi:hypothetical protein